jgi:hypothetical protein
LEPPLAREASAAAAAVVLPRYCDLPEVPMASAAKAKHVAVPLDPPAKAAKAAAAAAAKPPAVPAAMAPDHAEAAAGV